jgi:hypothetical protein
LPKLYLSPPDIGASDAFHVVQAAGDVVDYLAHDLLDLSR